MHGLIDTLQRKDKFVAEEIQSKFNMVMIPFAFFRIFLLNTPTLTFVEGNKHALL